MWIFVTGFKSGSFFAVTFTIMQILGQRLFGFGYFLIADHARKVFREVLSNCSTRCSDTAKHLELLVLVVTDG